MKIIKIDENTVEVDGKVYEARKEKYHRHFNQIAAMLMVEYTDDLSNADTDKERKYIDALLNVRAAIRENGQEGTRTTARWCFIMFEGGLRPVHCAALPSSGEIRVMDEGFAEWLIANYADDLKILAGVE